MNVIGSQAEQKADTTDKSSRQTGSKYDSVTGTSSITSSQRRYRTQHSANEFSWTIEYVTGSAKGNKRTSYYKLINSKWVNYKYYDFYVSTDGSTGAETFYFAYNTATGSSSTTTNGVAFNCVSMYNNEPIVSKLVRDYRTASKVRRSYTEKTYSVTDPSSYYPVYEIYYLYHSNGIPSSSTQTWGTSAGKTTRTIDCSYDTRGRLSQKTDRNAKRNRTFHDRRTYYSNNKIKERYYTWYNPNVSMRNTKGFYFKYRSNGKKQIKKRMFYNKSGKFTKMDTYVYNKKGQLKSNKYGNSYKYRTYMKGYYVKKVVRAKYSKKGKMGKAKKIKPNKLSRTYYEF